MASGRVLTSIISKTKKVIEGFVSSHGGQSIQKQILKEAATRAGIVDVNICNFTYNGKEGACLEIRNSEDKDTHIIVRKSVRLEYYVETKPNDVLKKQTEKMISTWFFKI